MPFYESMQALQAREARKARECVTKQNRIRKSEL